jgi:hypothetical protein
MTTFSSASRTRFFFWLRSRPRIRFQRCCIERICVVLFFFKGTDTHAFGASFHIGFLDLVDALIETFFADQLRMRAVLGDAALFQHENLIRILRGLKCAG